MTCQAVAEFLSDYLAGELRPDVRRAFERHVDLCPACRHYIAAFKTAIELGREACADENAIAAEAGVPADLIAAILAASRR